MRRRFSIHTVCAHTATFFLLLILIACQTLHQSNFEDNPYISLRTLEVEGLTMDFIFVEPESDYPDDPHPALIVFPPGEQHREAAEWALEQYWLNSCIYRNWVVACPIAPEGLAFYKGAEVWMPHLMDWIQDRYSVEDDKFHLAGNSAGGYSSFRVALRDTARCRSILAMPGYPVGGDFDKLDRLGNIPVVMFAGEYDIDFIAGMDSTATRLEELGFYVRFNIIYNEDHNIYSLNSDYLLDILDEFRK